MDIEIFDSHTHLHFEEFSNNIDEIIAQANDNYIKFFLVAATSSSEFLRLKCFASQYKNIYIAFGLHPLFVKDKKAELDQLAKALNNGDIQKPCAIGECGIDVKSMFTIDEQIAMLVFQLNLASQFNLPVILHVTDKKSHSLVLNLIKEQCFKNGGIIHAFNGSFEQYKQYVKLNFYIGIGGNFIKPHNTKLRALLQKLDKNHIVLETDSPSMNPFATQINVPANLLEISRQIAELLNIDLQTLTQACTENTFKALKIKRSIM